MKTKKSKLKEYLKELVTITLNIIDEEFKKPVNDIEYTNKDVYFYNRGKYDTLNYMREKMIDILNSL